MAVCTVCDRVIAHQLLMCSKHWKLVPPAQQGAVYQAFGVCVRTSIKDAPAWAAARQAHRDACDAATATVKAAIAAPGPTAEANFSAQSDGQAPFTWRV